MLPSQFAAVLPAEKRPWKHTKSATFRTGVTVLPSSDGKVLRFRDADGFAVEVRGV